MPYPHCVLCTLRKWDRWLIPICSGRVSAGLGLFLAPLLTRSPHLNVEGARQDAEVYQAKLARTDTWDLLNPVELQAAADALRIAFQNAPSEKLEQQILWMERRRELGLRQALLQSNFTYDMEFLMSCLIMSGFLRNVAMLGDALRFAVLVGIQDPSLRAHVLNMLTQKHAIPSTTTLRRHQLTAHMGFCLWEQQRHGELLKNGCVRYGTVDSSPQGPQDWVLHGARSIELKDVVGAMITANKLCDETTTAEEKTVLVAKLEPLLVISQGVPTAVGSGNAKVSCPCMT